MTPSSRRREGGWGPIVAAAVVSLRLMDYVNGTYSTMIDETRVELLAVGCVLGVGTVVALVRRLGRAGPTAGSLSG